MLAEIYLLRLEAIVRTSKDPAPVSNTRFVPITLPQTALSRDPRCLISGRSWRQADLPKTSLNRRS